jgi:tetratricopeptide (TPR) repeat protein
MKWKTPAHIVAQLNQARDAYVRRDWPLAERLLRETLELCDADGDAARAAACLSNLASVLQAQGRLREAMGASLGAARIVRRRRVGASDDAYAAALTNIGVLLTQLRRPRRALRVLRTALRLRRRGGNGLAIAACLTAIAGAYRDLRRLDRALTVVLIARRLRHASGDPAAMAMASEALAALYAQSGRGAEARQESLLAVTHRRALGETSPLISALNLAAQIWSTHDPSRATAMLREAEGIATAAGDTATVARCLANRGQLLRHSHWTQAKDLLQRAYQLFVQIGDARAAAWTHDALGAEGGDIQGRLNHPPVPTGGGSGLRAPSVQRSR